LRSVRGPPGEPVQQRVRPPAQRSTQRFGRDQLGREEHAPALGRVAGVVAAEPDHFARRDHERVAAAQRPFPCAQAQGAGAALKVGQDQEVVHVGVLGALVRLGQLIGGEAQHADRRPGRGADELVHRRAVDPPPGRSGGGQ
jgi:hypothetical protein